MSRSTYVSALLLLLSGAPIHAAEPQLDDPMRPYITPPRAANVQDAARPFTLTGVLIAATRRVAVINGSLYREGDTINGARIVRIDPGSVRLQRGAENLIVQLAQRPRSARTNHGDPVQ